MTFLKSKSLLANETPKDIVGEVRQDGRKDSIKKQMDRIKRTKILRPGRLKTRERDRTVLESAEIKIIAQRTVFQKEYFWGGVGTFFIEALWSRLERTGNPLRGQKGAWMIILLSIIQ